MAVWRLVVAAERRMSDQSAVMRLPDSWTLSYVILMVRISCSHYICYVDTCVVEPI